MLCKLNEYNSGTSQSHFENETKSGAQKYYNKHNKVKSAEFTVVKDAFCQR